MHDNILHDYRIRIPKAEHKTIEVLLADEWFNVNELYSYIVTIESDDLKIKYIISDTPEYNTINTQSAILKIKKAVTSIEDEDDCVLCFEQAPLEMYIQLHEPMIDTMASRIANQWSKLEYDDLCQICRMCCVELYAKGYYLHKKLIWTTFRNKIIEEVRGLKRRGVVVSIYDKSYDDLNNKDITIEDTLVDWDEVYQKQDAETLESEKLIFQEVKDIIIELIGKRQFDTLYRDYTNGHTTTTSRKLLVKVKNHLATLGLSRDDFNKKYH